MPTGFPACVRIFHAGTRYWWDGPVNKRGSTRLRDQPISWTEAAALTGAIAHPWMQWGTISRHQTEEADLGDGTSLDGPEDGRLPREVLDPLLPLLVAATTVADDVTAAVWEGWGELHHVTLFGWSEKTGSASTSTLTGTDLGVDASVSRALDHGPLLQLPSRNYVLLEGHLQDLTDPHWTTAAGLGRGMSEDGVAAPQLLWPADRAWCLATEIDFGFTLLAGPVDLINHVLATNEIEAALLDQDGDLSWDGDTLNPRALHR